MFGFSFLEIRKTSDVASVFATESCYICSAVSLYNQPETQRSGIPNRFSFIPLYVVLVFVKQREKLKRNKVQTCLVVVRETPMSGFFLRDFEALETVAFMTSQQ